MRAEHGDNGKEKLTIGRGVRAFFSRPTVLWWQIGAVVVGAMLARWTWVLFAPASVAVAPALDEISPKSAAGLFGAVTSAVPATAAASLPNVRLLGVFSGARGFAILELADKTQRGVALGEEVVPGVKLLEAAEDYVLLGNGGQVQRVELVQQGAGSAGVLHESTVPLVSNAPVNETQRVQQVVQEWTAAHQAVIQERERSGPAQAGRLGVGQLGLRQ